MSRPNDCRGHTYATDDHFLYDIRAHPPVLHYLSNVTTDHVTTNGFSKFLQVSDLLRRTSDITRWHMLREGVLPPGRRLAGFSGGDESLEKPLISLDGGVFEQPE